MAIPNLEGNQEVYFLSGVIVHHGKRVDSGHYTAYICVESKWYCMNDMKVTEETEIAVRNSQGYILVYQKNQI